jgi:hypothetical protein
LRNAQSDGYDEEKEVIHVILTTISERTHQSFSELETMLVQGCLKGTTMHLRVIEHHFGPHSLRVLAKLGQFASYSDSHSSILNSMVLKWFTIDAGSPERFNLLGRIVNYPTPQTLVREAQDGSKKDS